MKTTLYYITIASICILTLLSCEKHENTSLEENNKETTQQMQQQKIPYAAQLTEKLITNITKEIPIKDTLFLATHRLMPICGNEYDDPDYAKREAEAELNHIKANPYYIDSQSDYQTYYNLEDKVVVTGEAFEDEIEVADKTYTTKNKLILDLYYNQVTPDSVIAVVHNWAKPSGKQIEFTLTRQDSLWNLVNVGNVDKP